MVKRSSLNTPLSLSLLLFIIIAALQFEASVPIPMKTFHYVKEGKNWSDAQQHCKETFTDLASAEGQREDLVDELAKIEAKCVWVGLYRDPGNMSVWRWTEGRGDASSDTNWATGETEMWRCTLVDYYNNRKWYNTKCTDVLWGVYCSNANGDNVVHESSWLSWLDAQERCKDKGMVLATVTHQSNRRQFHHVGWIGLHIPPDTPGNYTSKDIWKWIGDDSDYRNWAPGWPKHENCGFLSIDTDRWYSASCSDPLPFVCVADNAILVKENKTWEEALDHCRAIGSDDPSQHNHYREHQYDLVSLQSDHDHRYARDKIQEATTNEVWTALRFLAGEWLWVDGEPLQYQNLPLCPAWGRRCGTLPKNHTTQWETRDCMEKRNFLCIKSPAKTDG